MLLLKSNRKIQTSNGSSSQKLAAKTSSLWIVNPTRISRMLKNLILSAGGMPWMRKLAKRSFALPLVGRAIRHSAQRVLPRGERTWVRIEQGLGRGLWVKIEPYWEPGYLQGSPEPGVTECLLQHLSEGDCFYDIGAHIGYYSLVAARRVGPQGHVVAVEPDPDNIETLRENTMKNHFSWVEIVTAAVWNSVGEMLFEKGADTPSRMAGRIVKDGTSSSVPDDVTRCQSVTVDYLSSHHRPPNAIKVDVEGGEVEVLHGAQATLSKHRPMLLIEAHSVETVPVLSEFLEPFGYTIRHLPAKTGNVHVCCEPPA
jgi:FkbM family methyltransferase